MSSLYTDLAGAGSVVAAKMAVEDSGIEKRGYKVEIVSADHQNKPDIGSAIARQWYDVDKVDVIVDVPNSGVALAVNQITKDKGKAFLVSGAASSDLTGKACTPNTIHWTYDTWMLANGTGSAIVKTGGDSWFFLTADYAFGHALERDTEAVVLKNGGKVLGKVRAPLNTQDFSSFLLQAQASKAKIIGLANAGGDTTNSIKQAAEFGIVKGGQNLAGLLVFLTDIHALGLPTAQGLIVTNTFYWDQNDQTRAFAKRFAAQDKGIHPTMVHAGVYSSVLHYLKAVEALKSDDGTKVIAKMKEMPTDDPLFGKGSDPRRRPQDPSGVPRRGEEARRVEGTVGLLQGPRDDPGGPGVPSAQGRRLPAGEIATRPRPATRRVVLASPRARGEGRASSGRSRRSTRIHDRTHARDRTLRHPGAGPVRPAADRAHQRRVLRDAEPRARRHLRPAQHHQLHARRAVHDGRVLRVVPARALGVGYWWSLLLAPLLVGVTGVVIERTMLSRLYKLDHLYGLLLTFGLALIIQGVFTQLLRQLRPAVPAARGVRRRRSTSASCSCRSTARG